MFDYIMNNYKGVEATLIVTGLPVAVTGEVMGSTNNIINLRLESGVVVHISADKIAFVY